MYLHRERPLKFKEDKLSFTNSVAVSVRKLMIDRQSRTELITGRVRDRLTK